MKARIWGVLVIGVLILAALPFCGAISAEAKVIELRYANMFPPTHIHTKLPVAWGKEIEKRTNGRVKFTHFPGGALAGGKEMFDSVLKGIADIGTSVPAYTTGRFPVMETHNYFFGFPSGMAATLMINDFYNKFKPKELNNVKVLYWSAHGPGLLHSKKLVKTLEDLKGMKIRCTGTNALMVKNLGGLPVAMPQGAAYEALQKGIVEGTFAPSEVLKGYKQGEVIKYTTMCYDVAYSQQLYYVMNLDKWNSLPKDIQKVFDDVSKEWIVKTGAAWDQVEKEGLEFSLSIGNEKVELAPEESKRWVKAVQPVVDEFIKTMEAKGYPAKEYIEEYKILLKKYGNR